jgi:isopenicillin N synthase-like dioxygenase
MGMEIIIMLEKYSSPDDRLKKRGVPVIDLEGRSFENNCKRYSELAEEIGAACRDWGFFQVVNHGISNISMDATWLATKKFFSLSNPWGFFDHELTKNKRDKKEIFDIGPTVNNRIRSSDQPFLGETPWPNSFPEFEHYMRKHFEACEELSLFILQGICASLGVDKDYLTNCFYPEHTSFLRLNYYPVIDPLADLSENEYGEVGLGVHHHTDAGALTILSQDDIGGLQVHKDDIWFPINPVAEALVINIGDMVQVWSNGEYKAALHRVVAMEEEDRYSLPFFFNPTYSTNINPLIFSGSSKKYNEINWGEFRRKRADGDFANLGKEVQINDYLIR